MIELYNTILFQQLFNALIFLYNVTGDIGIAIVLLTIVIKIILYPLSHQAIRSQKALLKLQPKIDALRAKYKDSREKMAQELMALYKAQKVNPLSSCLPLLIQLPFLIAVYQVFIRGLDAAPFELLYPVVANPGLIDNLSLGFVDMGERNIILAVLAGAAQFWQAKMLVTRRPAQAVPGSKDENMMAMMNKQMVYFMPALTFFIGLSLPGGLVLYWFVVTLLTALQQLWMFRGDKPNAPDQPEVVGAGTSSTPQP